ncbi:ATP-binding cassette domain-containing protein [Streptacidiphilus cavernicola]|uniref:ATP-binding cassette domain-containing protein n=1 Tax=Streptacidiphilus cavernicola TaxID=3342716 RepID=A0ABV6VT83_9ACTN
MRLDGIALRYGLRDPWVLYGVDLDVPTGQLIRAQGGNGGGKSTLLRLVAGVRTPTRGSVRDQPARRAYVPERFPAALPFTAHDYLCHLGRIHGLRGAEPARRADALLDRFGAAAFARTPLAELSKGTCQKVAVAQALLGEPELLVLDEAWTGLDQASRAELDAAVDERLAQGGTVLFVDHDPGRLADRPTLRWQVGDGSVTATDAPSKSAASTTATTTTVRITLTADAALLSELRNDPRVRIEQTEALT